MFLDKINEKAPFLFIKSAKILKKELKTRISYVKIKLI